MTIGAADFANPCGGKRWRTHSDESIEVEGEGVPVYGPKDERFKYLTKTWQNFGPLFQKAARAHDVPVSWLVAVASVETGFLSSNPTAQAHAMSPVGAIGVMQFMPSTAGMFGYSPSDMLVPAKSIDAGAQLLKKLGASTGDELPAMSAMYNSGKMCSPGHNEWNLYADGNYPRQALTYNNTALAVLDLGAGNVLKILGLTLAVGGIGAAVWILR